MTLIKRKKNNLKLDNYQDSCFYQILKIIKIRETSTMAIFYPKTRVSHCGETRMRKKSLVMVEKNLFSGKYTHSPWKFVKDVNEAFETIKKTNNAKSKTYRAACKFQEIFSCQMDDLMETMGYCCGRWYVLEARELVCSGGNSCIIRAETVYHRFEDWTFCQKCFDNQEPTMELENMLIQKSVFVQHYFRAAKPEQFVLCHICSRKVHEICVLFHRVSGQNFYCKQCRLENGFEMLEIHAKNLPATECDVYISQFLAQNNVNEDELITIRMLSDVQKLLEKKPIFDDFHQGKYSYRNCSLFSFFDTGNGTDICFFAVMFQLYGSDCAQPNQNTAYISYIDSVNLLPSNNRTKIYRLLLLGLIAFLKTKGYQKLYLWSCPPKQNQDYIFYMKPPQMRMPTRSRLSKWYREMLLMGVQLKVIESYKGISQHAEFEGWTGISRIPYLDGDLWVIRMEEAIMQVRKETTKLLDELSRLKEKSNAATTSGSRQKFAQLAVSKEKELEAYNKNSRIWQLVNFQLKCFNHDYFVIQLGSSAVVDDQTSIETAKARMWLNNRHLFIDFFWGFMLEFSSDRRAQFSTYVMLYRIFAEGKMCLKCNRTSVEGVTASLLCRDCHDKFSVTEKLKNQHATPSPVKDWKSWSTDLHRDHSYSSKAALPTEILAPKTPDSGYGYGSSPNQMLAIDNELEELLEVPKADLSSECDNVTIAEERIENENASREVSGFNSYDYSAYKASETAPNECVLMQEIQTSLNEISETKVQQSLPLEIVKLDCCPLRGRRKQIFEAKIEESFATEMEEKSSLYELDLDSFSMSSASDDSDVEFVSEEASQITKPSKPHSDAIGANLVVCLDTTDSDDSSS